MTEELNEAPETATPQEVETAETTEVSPQETESTETGSQEIEQTESQEPAKETLTLAESTEEKPVEVIADWPDDWREKLSGDDDKLLKRLKRFQSPKGFAKSWLAAQEKISEGVRQKPDGEDDEAVNQWRSEVGLPESPEGYIENLPDGLIVGEDDKEMLGSFLGEMHESDAPVDLVHKVLAWYYKSQEKGVADLMKSDAENRTNFEDEMRAELGSEFRSGINSISTLVDAHAPEGFKDRLFTARFADGTPFGDDPEALRFLMAVSREVNPYGTVTPATGKSVTQTIDAEIAELKAEMQDTKGKNSDYYTNDEKQARYRELLEMKERQKK